MADFPEWARTEILALKKRLASVAGITALTGHVTASGSGSQAATLAVAQRTRQIQITIDGGGSVITTGAKKVYVRVPVACTIVGARVFADQSGSIVLDVWKDSYANFPPTVADTITASAKPTLSSAIKSEDTTLTGWTTSLAAGDILEVNVDSASTVTKVQLVLVVTVN